MPLLKLKYFPFFLPAEDLEAGFLAALLGAGLDRGAEGPAVFKAKAVS